MCDQTELSYGDGDVVWVKIGPIWWPGVVEDIEKEGKGKEVLGGLRTKPIASVKFFEEDKYEFVKNLENIYHYNCRRKDEFIKKGLDKLRAGVKHMAKFPEDVEKAEALVNGDVNILKHPKFAPQEKTNYSDIFGTPKKKIKKSEDTQLKTKFLPLKKRLSAPARQVHVRNQNDGTTPRDKGEFSCPFCNFSARFVTAISSHVSIAHSARRVDYGSTGCSPSSVARCYTEPRVSRHTPASGKKRGRPAKPKQGTPKVSTEKVEDIEKTSIKRPTPTVASEKTTEKKKRFTDALLADWSEDENVKDEENSETEKDGVQEVPKTDIEPLEESSLLEKNDSVEEPAINSSGSVEAVEETDKKESASCFDFDEEDDGFIGMSNANTYGRKIPRVIPVKDKTDLGMDLEIEELFKRKPDSEQDDEDSSEKEEVKPEPPKKRRGRPPKELNKEIETAPKAITRVNKTPVKAVEVNLETLAATRERRPGSRKSYLKEVIEKIDENSEVVRGGGDDDDGEEHPKPSRRKQDLKGQSLMELDDMEPLLVAKKKKSLSQDYSPTVKFPQKKKNSISIEDSDDLTAQVQSLLAETSAPLISPTPSSPFKSGNRNEQLDDDLLEGTVEYLEDEPEPILPSPDKSQTTTSPIKKWKEDIRIALDGDAIVKKSTIPQWKQDIQEAMKAYKEPQPPKDLITESKAEPVISNVVKLSQLKTVQQKGSTYYIMKPQNRPKILGKPQTQQVVLVTNPRNIQQRVKVVSAAKPSIAQTAAQPVLQLIPDGKGGMKKVQLSKKVIQIAKNSPQKYVLSGKGREGLHVIENYNGTGKTVIVKEVGSVVGGAGATGQTILGFRKKVPPISSTGSSAEPHYSIKRVKGPDGKYTIQKIVKGVRMVGGEKAYAIPQQRQLVFKTHEPVKMAVPEPEPVLETPVMEQAMEVAPEPMSPVVGTQQVVAMGTGADGQATYMLVTVDGSGNFQAVDGSSLLSYEVQPEVSQRLYSTSADDLTPVYSSAGQDILAEALANTNVLETEMPLTSLMMPSVVQETSVTLQKPIMTPLEMPSTVIPDTTGLLIAPVVQETSVTLQKPIMTPVEVPSLIVPDTSGLEPPPLPPTPTEDVLMEESEGGLMIAEPLVEEQEVPAEQHQQQPPPEEPNDENVVLEPDRHTVQGDFFIDDSQEGEEVNSFQSMPLLNEESTASEEPIGDQHFEVQGTRIENSEYLPTSTNPDLEPEQSEEVGEEALLTYAEPQEEGKEGKESSTQSSMPFITEDGFVVDGRSQETEVSSTTGDSKDNVV